ncbi:MAG: YlxR family protein [Bacilli bacterium]|nr:YlxR family protein [Bacilli bacterium]
MKPRPIPLRTCVITKEKLPKKELIRVVRTPEGNVIVDEDKNGKTNGRGAYLKKALEVIELAKKTKALEKHLETKIDDELYKNLVKIIQK